MKVFTRIFVCFVCLSPLSLSVILAQDAKVEVESSGKSEGKLLIVGETPGKIITNAPKVFVEQGSEELAGTPEDRIKVAYRTWEERCKEWKRELRQLNGGNLMIASCGSPSREVETINSEKLYTYKSKGHYKIRVIGK